MNNFERKITAIKAGKNPRVQRSNIFLDGKFAFSLNDEVIVKQGLKVGQEFNARQIEGLAGADRVQSCLNAALHFLSYRPRSESETRARLQKRGYENAEMDKAIEHLKETHLLDDAAFAEYWKDNRTSFRPRSERLLKMELRLKGVESNIINDAVENIDEAANAYRAAAAKARTLPADYQVFRQRLIGYLQRRGFGYVIANQTIKQVWAEKTGILQEDLDTDS